MSVHVDAFMEIFFRNDWLSITEGMCGWKIKLGWRFLSIADWKNWKMLVLKFNWFKLKSCVGFSSPFLKIYTLNRPFWPFLKNYFGYRSVFWLESKGIKWKTNYLD